MDGGMTSLLNGNLTIGPPLLLEVYELFAYIRGGKAHNGKARHSTLDDEVEELYPERNETLQPVSQMGREFAIDFGRIDPVPASRDAWKALRIHNPLIASSIDESKRYYRVASEQEPDSWLEEIFIVHTASESYHHSAPRRPIELAPPLFFAANIPTVTENREVRVRIALNDWFAALPWLLIRASEIKRPPENTPAQRQKLTETETGPVIAAAKAKAFTPTHVVEAAAILVIAELETESAADKSYGS
ncbi:MAG: hypothetical protein Q9213_006211 [Squamulea squamosa]